MQEVGNVISRRAISIPATVSVDPLEPAMTKGITSDNLPSLDHQGLFSLQCGGAINIAHTFDGKVAFTENHSLNQGFADSLSKSCPVPQTVLEISTRGNDVAFMDDEERVFSMHHLANNKYTAPEEVNGLHGTTRFVTAGLHFHLCATYDH